ncbi:MAG UNVERIFIED_CONTAM: hypothetical protein LVT10_17360 [Anaerolineae bacterium]
MDGLLVDSERLWKIAETRILAERGKTYSKELHAPLIGRAVNEFVVGLIERYELDDTPQALASLLEERVLEVSAFRIHAPNPARQKSLNG